MKRCIADGSVGFPHVRVGHRQAPKKENPEYVSARGFVFWMRDSGCLQGLAWHDHVIVNESLVRQWVRHRRYSVMESPASNTLEIIAILLDSIAKAN